MDASGRGMAEVGSGAWLLAVHEEAGKCAFEETSRDTIEAALRILAKNFSVDEAWAMGPLIATSAGQETATVWTWQTSEAREETLILTEALAERVSKAQARSGAWLAEQRLRTAAAVEGELRYAKRCPRGRSWLVGLVGRELQGPNVAAALESVGERLIELIERAIAEELLQRAQTIEAAVWKRSAQGLALVSANGACIRTNRVASRLVGRPEAEMVHLAAREWLPAPLGLAAHGGGSGTWQGRLRGADGSEHFVDITQSQIQCQGEALTLVQLADRSEYAALEAQLEHLQRHRLMGRLSSGVVHDLNNLLTVVVAALEATERDPNSPFLPEMLSDGHEAVRRCESLCRQLLTMGSRSPGAVRVIPPDPTIAAMRKLLERTVPDDAEFSLSLRASGACIALPDGSIEQVLLTLLTSARDAMGRRGSVSVSTTVSGERFHLRVEDSGTSSAEALVGAFDPAATRGTTSGLAVAQALVAQVGGQLDVKSAPGQGTVFDVSFPLVTEELGQEDDAFVPEFDEDIPGEGRIVLLCENEAVLRDVIQRSLSQQGYEVVSSSDGRRGLELIEGGFAIDALVTDLVMPNVGGAEIAQACNRGGRQTPVVFVSGLLEREAIPDTGAPTHFLPKPFRMHDLLGALQSVLGPAAAKR